MRPMPVIELAISVDSETARTAEPHPQDGSQLQIITVNRPVSTYQPGSIAAVLCIEDGVTLLGKVVHSDPILNAVHVKLL